MENLPFNDAVVFTALLMFTGLVGCLLPFLPGPPLVWLGAFYYGYRTGWSEFGWPLLALLLLLALIGSTADVWMGYLGAKKSGASIWASLASIVGGIVGLLVFSLPGAILGALGAVVAVEYYQRRNWDAVWAASKGYLTGYVLSFFVQLFICFLIIGIFLLAIWL